MLNIYIYIYRERERERERERMTNGLRKHKQEKIPEWETCHTESETENDGLFLGGSDCNR